MHPVSVSNHNTRVEIIFCSGIAENYYIKASYTHNQTANGTDLTITAGVNKEMFYIFFGFCSKVTFFK